MEASRLPCPTWHGLEAQSRVVVGMTCIRATWHRRAQLCPMGLEGWERGREAGRSGGQKRTEWRALFDTCAVFGAAELKMLQGISSPSQRALEGPITVEQGVKQRALVKTGTSCEKSSEVYSMEAQSFDRPTDEAIVAQQNALKEEVAQLSPLLGDREPINALVKEYETNNEKFLEQIESLKSTYSAIRRTRGDGNCFFRSFLFALLEHLLLAKSSAQVAWIQSRIAASEQALRDLGYSEFTWEDFSQALKELLEDVSPDRAQGPISADDLLSKCRDEEVSNYALMFLRFLTSCEIQRRGAFFLPFLEGLSPAAASSAAVLAPEAAKAAVPPQVLQFCRTSVEAMGEESEHVHITALSAALAVAVRVEYLDGHASTTTRHDFVPEPEEEGGGEGREQSPLLLGGGGQGEAVKGRPPVVLLYRPGHYDILYPIE